MLEGSRKTRTLSLLCLAYVRHHSNGRGLFSHLHKSTPTLFLNGRPNRLCVARDERHRSDARRPFGTSSAKWPTTACDDRLSVRISRLTASHACLAISPKQSANPANPILGSGRYWKRGCRPDRVSSAHSRREVISEMRRHMVPLHVWQFGFLQRRLQLRVRDPIRKDWEPTRGTYSPICSSNGILVSSG